MQFPTRICVLLLLVWSSSAVALAQGSLKLSYLGTAGWEITDGQTVILVDPYLTRLKSNTPNDPALASDPRRLVTDQDFVTSDQAAIDAHIKSADYVLIRILTPTMCSICLISHARQPRWSSEPRARPISCATTEYQAARS